MSDEKEPADIAGLFEEVRRMGWAAVLQLGSFDYEGVEGTASRFSCFVYVPWPSRWGRHSDEEAIHPDNLDWDDAGEPVYADADTPLRAMTLAMESARRSWSYHLESATELRRDNRGSDVISAAQTTEAQP